MRWYFRHLPSRLACVMNKDYGHLIPVVDGIREPASAISLRKEVLLIGRRENCDIVLSSVRVSAAHCQLSYGDGFWHATDLGSRNGVKVNGTRIQPQKPCRIFIGDSLEIATYRYVVEYSPISIAANANVGWNPAPAAASSPVGPDDRQPHIQVDLEIPDYLDTKQVGESLSELVRALNAYHIALGGNGLEVGGAELYAPEFDPSEA